MYRRKEREKQGMIHTWEDDSIGCANHDSKIVVKYKPNSWFFKYRCCVIIIFFKFFFFAVL